MRIALFYFFILVSAQLFGQGGLPPMHKFADSSKKSIDTGKKTIDTAKKVFKIDSVMAYPDSTIIKVPARLMQAYLEVSHGNSDNIYVGQLKEIIALTEQQTNKQLVKKPKK
jgi:hypothetical protein